MACGRGRDRDLARGDRLRCCAASGRPVRLRARTRGSRDRSRRCWSVGLPRGDVARWPSADRRSLRWPPARGDDGRLPSPRCERGEPSPRCGRDDVPDFSERRPDAPGRGERLRSPRGDRPRRGECCASGSLLYRGLPVCDLGARAPCGPPRRRDRDLDLDLACCCLFRRLTRNAATPATAATPINAPTTTMAVEPPPPPPPETHVSSNGSVGLHRFWQAHEHTEHDTIASPPAGAADGVGSTLA